MKSMRDIMRSYAVFDEQGRHVNGTDKQSNHNYGDDYESLFVDGEDIVELNYGGVGRRLDSSRSKVRLVMEVGVADGSCLLAWRDIFPNATCVGMDIHPSDQAHGERIEFHLGDQCVQADCERAAAGRKFDLIVEDAMHCLSDTLLTLFYLWPFVKPGGLYVVEEFSNIGHLRPNVLALYPSAEVIDTNSPFGGIEPLTVFRKPL